MADSTIRAAGVVVLKGPASKPKVLIIHRPHRRDWSLPKGKLDNGEHVVAAAVRECDEESGIIPILSVPLGQQSYRTLGRDKTVDYWRARIGRHVRFAPDDEVDKILWVAPDEARRMLSYSRDADYLDRALAAPPTWPLILLRHTAAEKRSDFKGRDYRRPLTGRGRTHAKALIALLSAYGVESIISSTSTRCVETVRPFAQTSKKSLQRIPALSEESANRKPRAAVAKVQQLSLVKKSIVVCSHRPVLPLLLEPFLSDATKTQTKALKEPLSPGGLIVLHRSIAKGKWRIVAVERHDG
jgi:8-oxo-(d)GTP phosphatase